MAKFIPEDVFIEIVSHLDDPTDCVSCLRVCRAWNQYGKSEAFYKRLYDTYWNLGEVSEKSEMSYRSASVKE